VVCVSAEGRGSQGGLHQSRVSQPIVQVSARHRNQYRGLPWLVMSSSKAAKGAQGCLMSRGTGKGKLNKKSGEDPLIPKS
jgi:hypothetical protein